MLVHQADQLRAALSPVRRRLLERLGRPGSAPQLARELGMGRQKVGYHLKALEQAGLIELVEERQRRGCVERVYKATAEAFVVDPLLMTDGAAADHLVAAAAATVRDVARMQAAAAEHGKRLLTFTLEADVRLAGPQDVDRFATALAAAVQATAEQFDSPRGRRYRIVAGGHPTPKAAP